MKKLIFLFLVILIAVWLGLLMQKHPGYVLINVAHTQIEMSLWFAIIAILVLFLVLYFLLRLVAQIGNIANRYKTWSTHHKEQKSYQFSQTAIFELFQGHWNKARNTFIKAIRKNPDYLINYLGAAKAEQERKVFTQRDDLLKRAETMAKSEEVFSIKLVLAAWQLESQQYTQALETLTQLQRLEPSHPVVLRGFKDAYLALQQWEKLKDLLPKLEKYHALDPQDFKNLEHHVYSALLKQTSAQNSPEEVDGIWEDMPNKLHNDPALLSLYAEYLLTQNKHEKAENLLKYHLRKHLDKPTLDCYAKINSADPGKQLSRAEAWLEAHPNNPDLLYCLGNLCAKHRLWGKARSYLEKSLSIKTQPEAYHLLGYVLENLGDTKAAFACYRTAL